jgi:ribonuclease R
MVTLGKTTNLKLSKSKLLNLKSKRKEKMSKKFKEKRDLTETQVETVKLKIEDDPCREREIEKYAQPIPSREFILQHLSELGRPATYQHLLRVFDLNEPDAQEALQRRLKAMLRDGQLLSNRRGSYALVEHMSLVRGRISMHRDGYGFLLPDDGGDKVFLPPHHLRSAFPEDRALVSVTATDRSGRREGSVVEILEHTIKQVVGRFTKEDGVTLIISENKHILQDVLIPDGKEGNAKPGQIVVANIVSYPNKRHPAIGEVREILGEHMAPGMETDIAINAYNLPHHWSEEVLAEIKEFKKEIKISDEERKERKALQDLPFVTIDGEDAKDFDDAVYCEKSKERGGWRLYVAIADVSHYVKPNTALDKEALERGNSTYFPRRVIPMLPEILSNELCSLKPNVERLALVCEMAISEHGVIQRYAFYEAIICSRARLTYNEVRSMLEKKSSKQAALLPYLENLHKIYLELKKQRNKRGALNFDLPETRIVFGSGHKIKKIVPFERNFAHELIEECMLAANVCTAKFLSEHKVPSLYRVHEGPDKEKLANLKLFLGGMGLTLGGGQNPQPSDYAQVVTKVLGKPEQHVVQMVMLRSLQQAVYTPEEAGHFGLAYKHYAHFTSPIRRYPDLLNHRAIRHLLRTSKKEYFYTNTAMENLGAHCSMTERRSDDATRDVISWLKCEYMLDKVGKTFDGVISGVMQFGLFVELQDIYVEGLIHITALKNDYYKFDSVHHTLEGRHTRSTYHLGDQVRILVTRVDLDERQIDFALEENE